MWLDFAFIFLGLLFSLPLLSLARAQRKRTLAMAVVRAVEIARNHGWVSAGRLMVEVYIREKDAKEALADASGPAHSSRRRAILPKTGNKHFAYEAGSIDEAGCAIRAAEQKLAARLIPGKSRDRGFGLLCGA